MKRFLLMLSTAFLLIAALPPTFAAGTTATLSWTPSLEYNDCTPVAPATSCTGTTFPVTDIKEYIISWTGAFTGSLHVAAPSTTAQVPIPCNSVNFQVQEVTSATAKYPNATSDKSTPPVAYATGVTCRPKPVTGVTAS